jgi:hypothetical protein
VRIGFAEIRRRGRLAWHLACREPEERPRLARAEASEPERPGSDLLRERARQLAALRVRDQQGRARGR